MNKTDFEWHKAKNDENLQKHGVTFQEAVHAFYDDFRVIALAQKNSTELEKRYFCFGKDRNNNGVLTVSFTYRNKKIRIFGAGYWRKGKKLYDQRNNLQR
uniref:BrnT family toxin n=1 Tax=Ningiella ruwaisensis TaxID=2364274 RepID=UPI0010A0569C|nr:BrnT family toxin [Ningiella ruwaisensis]